MLQFRHLPSKLLEGRVAVPAIGIQTLRRMNIIPAGTFQTLRRTNIIPAGTFQTLRRMNIIPARIEKLLESRVAVQASGIQTLGRSNIIPEPIVQTLRRSCCSFGTCRLNYWKVVLQFRHLPSKLLESSDAVPEGIVQTLGWSNIIPARTFQTH